VFYGMYLGLRLSLEEVVWLARHPSQRCWCPKSEASWLIPRIHLRPFTAPLASVCSLPKTYFEEQDGWHRKCIVRHTPELVSRRKAVARYWRMSVGVVVDLHEELFLLVSRAIYPHNRLLIVSCHIGGSLCPLAALIMSPHLSVAAAYLV
jgi:hypothetical protein